MFEKFSLAIQHRHNVRLSPYKGFYQKTNGKQSYSQDKYTFSILNFIKFLKVLPKEYWQTDMRLVELLNYLAQHSIFYEPNQTILINENISFFNIILRNCWNSPEFIKNLDQKIIYILLSPQIAQDHMDYMNQMALVSNVLLNYKKGLNIQRTDVFEIQNKIERQTQLMVSLAKKVMEKYSAFEKICQRLRQSTNKQILDQTFQTKTYYKYKNSSAYIIAERIFQCFFKNEVYKVGILNPLLDSITTLDYQNFLNEKNLLKLIQIFMQINMNKIPLYTSNKIIQVKLFLIEVFMEKKYKTQNERSLEEKISTMKQTIGQKLSEQVLTYYKSIKSKEQSETVYILKSELNQMKQELQLYRRIKNQIEEFYDKLSKESLRKQQKIGKMEQKKESRRIFYESQLDVEMMSSEMKKQKKDENVDQKKGQK